MAILGPFNPAELVRAAQRLAFAATRRVRPDHRAIAARSVMFSPHTMMRFYLYVMVAPSRFALRRFDDGQVRRAQAFAADAFPGVFDTTPTYADKDVTLFAVESADGARERTLYVHPTGLVELLWALEPEDPGDGELVLDTAEMTAVITQLAAAVGWRPYAELSKAGRGRRRFARVDWWFHLATGDETLGLRLVDAIGVAEYSGQLGLLHMDTPQQRRECADLATIASATAPSSVTPINIRVPRSWSGRPLPCTRGLTSSRAQAPSVRYSSGVIPPGRLCS